jgi:hypothetical protein
MCPVSSIAQAQSAWEFRVTPYLWFAGIKGDVSTLPGVPVSPIEVTPSDALKDTESSFMGLFEAKKGKHGILLDTLYSDVRTDDVLIPQIDLTQRATSKSTVLTAAYVYELSSNDQAEVNVFAGARYWKVDTQLEFGGGLGILAGRSIRNAESWEDPLIGISGRAPIGESKFYVAGVLGLGGFGVGSDRFYDVSASVGYQWNKSIGTSLGYRRFDVTYEEGTFFYDVAQEGWLLGLTWSF